jgi:hypothetical protein
LSNGGEVPKPRTCWLGRSRRELVVGPCHHGPLKIKTLEKIKNINFNVENED